jgi:hypothetical protein
MEGFWRVFLSCGFSSLSMFELDMIGYHYLDIKKPEVVDILLVKA